MEVLDKNFKDFKETKLFKDQVYKKHFCVVDPITKKLTKKLKTSIDLESLDIFSTDSFVDKEIHLFKIKSKPMLR